MRVRFARIRTNQQRLGRNRILVQRRKRRVDEKHRTFGTQVTRGAECARVVDIASRAIDPGTLGAIERQLLAVHGEEILAEELAKVLEPVAEAADDRIVAQHRTACLVAVDDEENQRGQHERAGHEQEQRGHEFDGGQYPSGEIRLHAPLLKVEVVARYEHEQNPASLRPLISSLLFPGYKQLAVAARNE